MSDEYSAVLAGGLPLKGGLFKSKTKKKGKRKRQEADKAARAQNATIEDASSPGTKVDDLDSGSSSDDKAKKDGAGRDGGAGKVVEDLLTPAQRRFRQKQQEREAKRIRGIVKQTHRERIENFNALLASMTEHNDIPRCSAAGNG